MKKFLISFIIGVVMMAIGTTSLIFEMSRFEYVDAAANLKLDGFETKTIQLKDNEMLNLKFYDTGIGYHTNYDESMKDSVKITFVKGMDYRVNGNTIEIYEDSYETDFIKGWDAFEFFIDGLKEHKIYSINFSSITITGSRENIDRIRTDYSWRD